MNRLHASERCALLEPGKLITQWRDEHTNGKLIYKVQEMVYFSLFLHICFFLPLFTTFGAPFFVDPFTMDKRSHLVCTYALCCVPTLFHPFQPNLCGQKAIFIIFWPLLGPLGATFGTFWVWQIPQTGLTGCPQSFSNLVPTRSITN